MRATRPAFPPRFPSLGILGLALITACRTTPEVVLEDEEAVGIEPAVAREERTAPAEPPAIVPGSRPLFNGGDLTGWRSYRSAAWTVESGWIVGLQSEGHKGGWLVSEEEFSDFDLCLRYRVSPGGNSGVAFRYPGEGGPSKVAFEMQLGDSDPGFPAGSLQNVVAAPAGLERVGGWNDARICARGPSIETFINGRPAVRYMRGEPRRGHIAFQVHGGEPYAGMRVELSAVSILELPAAR